MIELYNVLLMKNIFFNINWHCFVIKQNKKLAFKCSFITTYRVLVLWIILIVINNGRHVYKG